MLRLDHVVHAVADRERAAAQMRALGLQAAIGGEHPNWGTQNALAYSADLSYIEWVAVRNPEVAEASDFGSMLLRFLERGEGVATAALRTGSLDDAVAHLRSAGIPMGEPAQGSRQLPDGTWLTWRLAFAPFPLPFLIEWAQPDAERQADLARRGAGGPPGSRVESLFWAVNDLAAGTGWLGGGYGATIYSEVVEPGLNARCRASSAGITLCEPIGPGPVAQRLAERGEGPVGYRLSGFGLSGRATAMGAYLELG